MFPASRAAWVPVFIATPTSACASAGASFVPSPVIATSRPSACWRRISSSFASGVASARKSSTPDSSAIFAAVSRLSPVTMIVRMPIARSRSKRSRMPSLTTSLSSITPSTWLSRATASGVDPWRATRSSSDSSSGGAWPPSSVAQRSTASPAPLRRRVPFSSTPLMRVWAVNGTKRASSVENSCSRSPYRRFGADGGAITEELTANADPAGGQEFPDVAVQPDGDFAIAWTESDDGIEARFFTTPEGAGTSPNPNPNPNPPPPTNPSPPPLQPLPPPDAPEFSDFVTFSSNKGCVKRIKLRVKGASKITVRIKGKKVATKVKPKLVIKKLPKGRFKLKVTVVSKDGQTFKGARSFKRCVRPKK
jgi:hypothetical protein